MDDAREEMRKLIDVIENGAKSTSVEQAVDDIKLFANTASFLANKLDTRLKGGEVQAKSKPKSRIGKSIASVPKPNAPPTSTSSWPTEPSSTNTSGMPTATSVARSQADFERLKPQGSQPPVGAS
jgi:hypothetical protein